MKTHIQKLSLVLLGLGCLTLGLRKPASAAPTGDINVTVSVDFVAITVSSTSWAIGQVAAGSTNLSSAIGVANAGNVQEDFRLSLAYAGSWTPGATNSPGADTFALLGLFTTTPAGTLVNGDFGVTNATDDLITTSAQTATATLYGITAEGTSAKGFDVTTGAPNRSLFLDFRAPTSNTISAQQSMTVTVTAIAG